MTNYNQLFQEALAIFNNKMGTDFSSQNIMLCICKPNKFNSIRKQFIKEFSFEISDNNDNSADTTLAEAFVYGINNNLPVSGIIIVERDKGTDAYEIMHTFLHELSHIFCVKNEIPSGHFYDDYCSDTSLSAENKIENGYYNAGYAIWRELVAELLSYSILSPEPFGIDSVTADSDYYNTNIGPYNLLSKTITSDLLVSLLLTEEAAMCSLGEFVRIVDNSPLSFVEELLKIVMLQLYKEQFYKITSEFIFDLGVAYITMLAKKSI